MLQWADVWVADRRARSELGRKALFFIPSAFEKLDPLGITQTALYSRASTMKSPTSNGHEASNRSVAGRAAIRDVMVGFPVAYRSAAGFIHVANTTLAERGVDFTFGNLDIVACIFRLKDAPEVVNALGVTADDIAKNCHISLEIIESAVRRFRITYNHANSIWQYLLRVKMEKNPNDPLLDILNEDPTDLIKTDVRSNLPMAVRLRQGRSRPNAEKDPESYVYGAADLTPAPTTGHPWAVNGQRPTIVTP